MSNISNTITVRIKSAVAPSLWYANKINQEFDVHDSLNNADKAYKLVADKTKIIHPRDCDIITSAQKHGQHVGRHERSSDTNSAVTASVSGMHTVIF